MEHETKINPESLTKTEYAKWVFLAGSIALFILTLLFYFTDWDLAITGWGYDQTLPEGERFFLAHDQPWDWLYEYDEVITAIFVLILLSFIILGLARTNYRPLVRYGIFMLLAWALGPGLVVNIIFKGMYGRPRPRDTIPFNPDSTTPFYRVWQPAFLDGYDGASFPSGHPAGPLIFISIFFALNHPRALAKILKKDSKRAVTFIRVGKWVALAETFIVGFLMGVARILQGGHFASDVLWSFGFVFLITGALYYLIFRFPRWERETLQDILESPISNSTG